MATEEALTLDETEFGDGKLVFEYEDNAKIEGYMSANILRVVYLRSFGPSDIAGEVGEQIFPASDFPAALEIYRKRKASKCPPRRIGGYYHVSTWLTPEIQPVRFGSRP